MVHRHPWQLCLLCLLRKADKTGSHFVPAGLLKGTIGKRDYEEAHSIDPTDVSTASHYGRSNLKNTNPEATQNPHVADYIFCSTCEDNLAKLESAIIPLLDKEIYDQGKAANFTESKINEEITLKECKKANSSVFNLLVYSLVWRVSLQQRLDHQGILVSVPFDETLRNILNNNLEKSIDKIGKSDIQFPFRYTIITCKDITNKTATFVNPNVMLTNPYLFYVGTCLVLMEHEACAANAKVSTLPVEILDKKFLNGNKGERIKIVFVSREVWDEVEYQMVEYSHKEFTKNMVIRFAERKNISLEMAAMILQEKSDEISSQTQDPTKYFERLTTFYEEEMK